MRVAEGGAAVVDHRDPAVEVGVFVVARDRQNVVRVPGKIIREIRSFNLLPARAGILQRHEQRRPVIKIRGNFGEAIAFGEHSGDNVVPDFPDWTVVV